MAEVPDKVVGYFRVSTAKQGESGLGLEAQMAAIEQYVKSTGAALLATYTEVETGKNCDRPQLAAALNHARRTRATLLIAKLDRLARNVAFIANLMESGVPFLSVDAPDDQPFILHVKASFAEEETRRISQRTKAALAAAKARGKILGSANGVSKGFLADPEKAHQGRIKGAQVVRQQAKETYEYVAPLIRKYREMGFFYDDIAAKLNEQGEKMPSGKPWTARQVGRVISYVSGDSSG